MSAFTVSKTHIDVLIQAGLDADYGPMRWFPDDTDWSKAPSLDHLNADEVGTMLWDENFASVNHRYNETEKHAGYSYQRLPGTPDPLVVLKAIACYEYQSCEHPAWHASSAKAFCNALTKAMIAKLPGYREADGWGIGDTDRDVFTEMPHPAIQGATTR